jgi:Uma2 family endonuclease
VSITAEAEAPGTWTTFLRAWRELDVPEGWKAEITERGITMTPPPGGPHNDIADVLNKTLVRGVPDEWGIHQTQGLLIPALGHLYIPDLLVIPRAAERDDDGLYAASDALLVVEITSRGNAAADRKTKKWGYAHGRVPLYLLVDRWNPSGPRCALYSDPDGGQYHRSVDTAFGKPVELPSPFDLTVDTSRFA